MSRARTRYFIPHPGKGRVVECGEHLANKLARAPRSEWKPYPIATGTIDGVTLLYVRGVDGEVLCEIQSGQARKCVEAAIWVSAVHAMFALGLAGFASTAKAAA